jgi:hypothetical protein
LQTWYVTATWSVILANKTIVLPCYRYVSLYPEITLVFLPSIYVFLCYWAIPPFPFRFHAARFCNWAQKCTLVGLAMSLFLWPYVLLSGMKFVDPEYDRCMQSCDYIACDQARITLQYRGLTHPPDRTVSFFLDAVFGRSPRLSVKFLDTDIAFLQSPIPTKLSEYHIQVYHDTSAQHYFLMHTPIFYSKGSGNATSGRTLIIGDLFSCSWIANMDHIHVPELDPQPSQSRGTLPLNELRKHLWDGDFYTSAGMLSLTAELTRAVVQALSDTKVLETRQISRVVTVGGSVVGKQALLNALIIPSVTHVILDSPGAMGGVSDAIVGPCAETTRSLSLPARYNSWVNLDVRRYPHHMWDFAMEDLWVALIQQRKRLLVHIKSMDLWSNPLGTLASVRAARKKIGKTYANKLSLRFVEGDWWDFEQHVSLLKSSDKASCDMIDSFVRSEWLENPAELIPLSFEQPILLEGADLLNEWIK